MNSTRLALILSPLAMAAATVVMWQGDDETGEIKHRSLTRGAMPSRPQPLDSFFELESAAEAKEALMGDRLGQSSEGIALRLHELTEVLGLTSDQRRQVRRLLERSSVHYDEASPIVGVHGEPLLRLTRVQAQEDIHDLLDPLQQAEYEDLLIDDQLWWAEVIARLENDLEKATDPVADLTEPAEPAEPAESMDSAPPEVPSHRGGNIFDLLNPPEP